jgi:hypothetical protein
MIGSNGREAADIEASMPRIEPLDVKIEADDRIQMAGTIIAVLSSQIIVQVSIFTMHLRPPCLDRLKSMTPPTFMDERNDLDEPNETMRSEMKRMMHV